MHLFYSPHIQTPEHTLPPDESLHCTRVLRLKKSDTVYLADGKGNMCTGKVLDPDPAGCRILITNVTENYGARPYHLHLAVAPTKNMERFEWFVEKATEVGVDIITPIICERSERKHCKTDRAERIAISALKQCKRAQMPVIEQAVKFEEFLRSPALEGAWAAIACCEAPQERTSAARGQMDNPVSLRNCSLLQERMPAVQWIKQAGERIVVLVGPEGDFSPAEVSAAIGAGCTPVDLGPSVLRTETAALGAVFLVAFK